MHTRKNLRKFLIYLLIAVVFAVALLTACISPRPGVDAPADIIHFPIGVAVHPSGRYAAVVNANFNQAYKNGSVAIVDLATYSIVADWTQPIGSFGGEVIFNHAGTRLFVAVRGEFFKQGELENEPADVVVAFDVDLQAAQNSPGDTPFFVAGSRQVLPVSPDPFGLAIDADDRYLYVTHISNGEFTVIQDDTMRVTDGAEVNDVAEDVPVRRCVPDTRICPDTSPAGALCGVCDSNADCGTTDVVVAGSGGGVPESFANSCVVNPIQPKLGGVCVSSCEVDETEINDEGQVVRLGCPDGYRCERMQAAHVVTERKFSRGGNQVALSPLTGTAYITHINSQSIGILRPSREDGVGFTANVDQVAFSDGVDLRGAAFNTAGSLLFIAARNVTVDDYDRPGVMIIDTSLTSDGCSREQFVLDTTQCETNRLVDFIEVELEPANIAWYNGMLYVTIYERDSLFVIDTALRQVVEVIDLAPENFISEPGIFREHARPYDITIYETNSGVWGLVSNFNAHELAVIRLFDADGNAVNRVERKIENRAKLYEEDQF